MILRARSHRSRLVFSVLSILVEHVREPGKGRGRAGQEGDETGRGGEKQTGARGTVKDEAESGGKWAETRKGRVPGKGKEGQLRGGGGGGESKVVAAAKREEEKGKERESN